MDTITKAASDVLAERRRQIEAEGWTPEHDDEHTQGELVQAAADLCVYGGLDLSSVNDLTALVLVCWWTTTATAWLAGD